MTQNRDLSSFRENNREGEGQRAQEERHRDSKMIQGLFRGRSIFIVLFIQTCAHIHAREKMRFRRDIINDLKGKLLKISLALPDRQDNK